MKILQSESTTCRCNWVCNVSSERYGQEEPGGTGNETPQAKIPYAELNNYKATI
jgi:hypothetical protein